MYIRRQQRLVRCYGGYFVNIVYLCLCGALLRWVSKTISSKKGKKHFKSTVLCVAFHPQNSQILACGSSDFKCNVFSVFSSDVDAAPDGGPFGAPVEFGDSYADFTSFGWVNAVAWSPSGSVLAFAGVLYA